MSIGGTPGQLTRFGAHEAAHGLSAVKVDVSFRSTDAWKAFGKLGLSRRPGQSRSEVVPTAPSDQDPASEDPESPLMPGANDVLYYACDGLSICCATENAQPGTIVVGSPGLEGEWKSADVNSEQFSGHIRSNPGFLYDDVRLSELLFTLDPRAVVIDTWGLAAATMDLAAKVARAAQAAAGPILFMQAPAAPYEGPVDPTLGDGSFELPRPSRGVVLRAAVGIDAGHAEQRLLFESSMERHARACGFGLEIRDRRPGMVRGDWRTLVEQDDDGARFESFTDRLCGGAPGERIRSVRPVTLVGPGRIGSSAACLSLLDSLGAGLCGISVTASQDIALINLVIADRQGESGGSDRIPPEPVDDYPGLNHGLSALAGDANRRPAFSVGSSHLELEESASDYVMVAGRPRLRAEGVTSGSPDSWAIWASWDLPAKVVSSDSVVQALLSGINAEWRLFGSHDPTPSRLEYCRSRLVSGGRVRGRAKVGVPKVGVSSDLSQTSLDAACRRAERHIRQSLREQFLNESAGSHGESAMRFPGDVRIDWRERWLGQGPFVM